MGLSRPFFLYGNCLLDRSSNTVLRVVLCTVLFVFLVAKTSSEEDELEEEDIQNDSFARLSKEFSQNMDNFLELLLPYEPSCPSVCQLAARSVCLLQFSKKAHIFLIPRFSCDFHAIFLGSNEHYIGDLF